MSANSESVLRNRRDVGTETKQNGSTASTSSTAPLPVAPTKTHKSVYVVFVSLLFDLLAFTMILPLLPSLLDYYKKTDTTGLYGQLLSLVQVFQEKIGAPDKYNSVLFGGVLGSMFSFLQFVASPIVGGLSDVYGRKPVLLVCLVSETSTKHDCCL